MKKNQKRRFLFETLETRRLLAVVAGSDSSPICEETGAATWIVNTLKDSGSWSTSDTIVSLREAIARSSNGDTIRFNPSVDGGTITLVKELTLTKGLNIDASTISKITISGNDSCRVMNIDLSSTSQPLKLTNLTISNGFVKDTQEGAGLFINAGLVSITNCTIKDSVVTGSIYTGTTRDGGGGIFNNAGNLTITNTAIIGNRTNYYGGGIQNISGTVTMVNCLIADNRSGSPMGYGGGIYNVSGRVTLTNCTVTNNTSAYGGGIYSYGSGGQINIYNSIVVQNTALSSGNDISTYSSSVKGYYVLSSYSDWTSYEETFSYNDKQTLFADAENSDYSLAQDSQAADIGNNTYVSTSTDIAGKSRIFNDVVDLGAYEYNTAVAAKISASIVVSYDRPESPSLETLPENLSSAQIGRVIYVQVWVKNADNSALGCTGGYVDLTYDPLILKAGTYTASSLFSEEATYCNTLFSGRVTLIGGCNTVGENDLGVDSWVLLGYVSFGVLDEGTSKLSVTIPSVNGEEYPALNLTRASVGTLATSEIDYQSITVKGSNTLEAPKILTGTNNIFPSYGQNRHKLEWTDTGAETYEINYSTDGKNWKSIYVSKTSTVITGLTYDTTVWYKVRSLGPSWSEASSEWSLTKNFYVCPVDIDGDGFVGPGDASYLSHSWFSTEEDDNWIASCDIDGDGFIGPGDRSYLSANWFSVPGDDNIINPPTAAMLFEDAQIIDEIFSFG